MALLSRRQLLWLVALSALTLFAGSWQSTLSKPHQHQPYHRRSVGTGAPDRRVQRPGSTLRPDGPGDLGRAAGTPPVRPQSTTHHAHVELLGTPPPPTAGAVDTGIVVDGLGDSPEVKVRGLNPRETRGERARLAIPSLFELLPDGRYLQQYRNPCWVDTTEPGNRTWCVPYFYLLGQVKCGTTDLWDRISRHPHINRGPLSKEQHWFSRNSRVSSRDYLRRYTRGSHVITTRDPTNVLGDGTPDTIWDRLRSFNNPMGFPRGPPFRMVKVAIAEVLAEVFPAARLVLILRDPVERLWSDFFYFAHRREHEIPLPPEEQVNASHFHAFAVRAVEHFQSCLADGKHGLRECSWLVRGRLYAGQTRLVMGNYAPFVMEYLANFEREQLLVLTLEEYHAQQKEVLARIFAHLNAKAPSEEEWQVILRRADAKNSQGERYKKLKMWDETRSLLRTFYAPFNTQLAELLDDPRYENWNAGGKAL